MESKMLEALRRYIQDYGWNWGIVHSLINRKFGTDYTLEGCSTSIYAAPGRSREKRAPFSNEPIVKAPGSRRKPRAGCFHRCSPGCTLPRRSRRRMIAVRER